MDTTQETFSIIIEQEREHDPTQLKIALLDHIVNTRKQILREKYSNRPPTERKYYHNEQHVDDLIESANFLFDQLYPQDTPEKNLQKALTAYRIAYHDDEQIGPGASEVASAGNAVDTLLEANRIYQEKYGKALFTDEEINDTDVAIFTTIPEFSTSKKGLVLQPLLNRASNFQQLCVPLVDLNAIALRGAAGHLKDGANLFLEIYAAKIFADDTTFDELSSLCRWLNTQVEFVQLRQTQVKAECAQLAESKNAGNFTDLSEEQLQTLTNILTNTEPYKQAQEYAQKKALLLNHTIEQLNKSELSDGEKKATLLAAIQITEPSGIDQYLETKEK